VRVNKRKREKGDDVSENARASELVREKEDGVGEKRAGERVSKRERERR
jgi:hypothetical protein